jgi:TP901 family phage tail tape measure protein
MAQASVEATLELKAKTKNLDNQLARVEERITRFGKRTTLMGARLKKMEDRFRDAGDAAKKMGLSIAAGAVAATAAFASYNTQATNVQNITEMNAAAMAKMSDQIMALPAELGEADDLMKGLYQTISAGITDSEDAFLVISKSAIAAKGNLADMTQTVDAATSVLNAYGLEATEITPVLDAMTKTVDLGKLTFEDLADNIGKGISIAASAGVSYQELMSIMATLTLNGLSVEEAMTAVRNILLVSLKPTKDTQKAMEELGVDLSAATLQSEGFAKWMGNAAEAVQGNAEMTAQLFPNIRALNGAMKLASTEGGAKYQEILDGVTDSAGKAQRNFERMSETFGEQAKATTTELKKLGIEFGEITANQMIPFLRHVRTASEAMRGMSDGAKRTVVTVAELTLALSGAVLIAPKAIAAYTGAAAAIKAMGAAALSTTGQLTAMRLAMLALPAVAVGIGLNLAINKWADAIDEASDRLLQASSDQQKEQLALFEVVREHGLEIASLTSEYGQLTEAMVEAVNPAHELHDIWVQTQAKLGDQGVLLEQFEQILKQAGVWETLSKEYENAWTMLEAGRRGYHILGTAYDAAAAKVDKLRRHEEALNKLREQELKLIKQVSAAEAKAAKEREKAAKERAKMVEKLTREMDELLEKSEAHRNTIERAIAHEALMGIVDERVSQAAALSDALENVTKTQSGLIKETLRLPGALGSAGGAFLLYGTALNNAKKTAEEATDGIEDLNQTLAEEVKPPSFTDWAARIDQNVRYMRESIAFGLMDGLTDGANSWGDILEGFADDWASILRDTLGEGLSQVFTGAGGFQEMLSNIGQQIQENPELFGLGGLAMVYQSTQGTSRTAGAMQGAMGGAMFGATIGGAIAGGATTGATAGSAAGPIGTVIGAVVGLIVGGLIGYFSSGKDAAETMASFGFRDGQYWATTATKGHQDVSPEEHIRIRQKLIGAFSELKMGYFALADLFQDPELLSLLGEMPEFDTQGWAEMTVTELAQYFTETWAMAGLDEMFMDVFRGGVTGLGVTGPTFALLQKEMRQLAGQQHIAALEKYFSTLIDGTKLLAKLGPDAIEAALNESARSKIENQIQNSIQQVDTLMAAWDSMTLLEATSQGQKAVSVIQDTFDAQMSYLQQIRDFSRQLAQQVELNVERLQLGGMNQFQQADFIAERLADIFDQLGMAGIDPNRAAELAAEAQRYLPMLEQLFGEDIDENIRRILTDAFGGRGDWLQNLGLTDFAGTGREYLIALWEQFGELGAEAAADAEQRQIELAQEQADRLADILSRLTDFAGASDQFGEDLGRAGGYGINALNDLSISAEDLSDGFGDLAAAMSNVATTFNELAIEGYTVNVTTEPMDLSVGVNISPAEIEQIVTDVYWRLEGRDTSDGVQ